MFHVETDSKDQVIRLGFIGHVTEEEMRDCRAVMTKIVAGMAPGFCLLTDLTALESMDAACAPDIGEIMNFCNERKIGSVVRVIPDPTKDIGFNILSHFHYDPNITPQTFENLEEALQSLACRKIASEANQL